jgi:NADH dehydrogenase
MPHVLILGAGFGGIAVARMLRGENVRVTIIDRQDFHTFQPLLYQVATDELAPSEIGFPVRELLHGYQSIQFFQTSATAIDLANRQVSVQDMPPIEYDYLVLALGATVNFFGTPGAKEHAFPLYTMRDAIRLKEQVLKQFEAAIRNPTRIDDGALTFAIVGGGPTGVELAGALADLLHGEFAKDYPGLPVDRAKVLLYEHSPHLLGAFKPKLQDYARNTLEGRGVTIQTGIAVTKVGPTSVELSSGDVVPAHTLVWAAGMQANPIVQSLGITLAHGGRVPVGPDLQLAGHPGVFAIGDIALATDGKTGKPLPGLGAVAQQAGRHVGENILRLVDGRSAEPFHYVDKGTMAQIGRGAAVVELPFGITLTGLPAWLAWLGVHLALLNNAEQKTSVFVDWGWNLLTHNRGKRMILEDTPDAG